MLPALFFRGAREGGGVTKTKQQKVGKSWTPFPRFAAEIATLRFFFFGFDFPRSVAPFFSFLRAPQQGSLVQNPFPILRHEGSFILFRLRYRYLMVGVWPFTDGD